MGPVTWALKSRRGSRGETGRRDLKSEKDSTRQRDFEDGGREPWAKEGEWLQRLKTTLS